MSVEGTWELVISTPIGVRRAVVELSTRDGVLRGVARDVRHDPEVVLADLVVDGDRLRWTQAITKPLRLNLAFDVTVGGDEMVGHSTAGRLPRSKVVGRRVG